MPPMQFAAQSLSVQRQSGRQVLLQIARLAAGRDHLLSKARERFHALLKMPVHHRTPLSAQSEIILHMIHCL